MVERRWGVADFFLFKLKNQKKMEKQQETTTINEGSVTINPIKKTPFAVHEHKGRRYLICGKVLLEINEKTDIEKLTEQLQKTDWEYMGLFIQAICAEMIKENNETHKN